MGIILKTQGIGKAFNDVWVLENIDFDLREGEIHALVGENGAGKSTFIKILSGIYAPSSGTIEMDDKAVVFCDAEQSEQVGIRTVHQEINLVGSFNIYQNVFVGSELYRRFGLTLIMDDREMKRRTQEVLELLGLNIDPAINVTGLNTSMKKIVEICKVLVHQPRIIVFDEPTTSLGEDERNRLLEIICKLKSQGISILYISHNLEEIEQIADRVTVFRDGHNVGTLEGEEIRSNTIISHMLGHDSFSFFARERTYCSDEILLEMQGVTTDRLKDVSLKIRRGEILGVAGVVGAGKTELAHAIFGLDRLKSGHMILNGKPFVPTISTAISRGIAMVPEERQAEGLIPDYTVAQNTTLTYLDRWVRSRLVIDKKAERITTEEYIDKLAIRTTGPDQLIKYLSGGNQQKVILSRWMLGDFQLGIFDDPTKGIDINAKEDIYALINELVNSGKSIIMLSSYLPELILNCDRILVLREGASVGIYSKDEPELENKIMSAMLRGVG